jgi:hypothetical protein
METRRKCSAAVENAELSQPWIPAMKVTLTGRTVSAEHVRRGTIITTEVPHLLY